MTLMCADDARIACPLFQAEYGGEVPTSALQLRLYRCSWLKFRELLSLWHSRLPDSGGFYTNGIFYVAEYNNIYYAVAGWSDPIAISFNGKGCFELRRFAIAPDAPSNTASRLLSVMVRLVKKERPDVQRLISYQDTAVHKGTIYKAQGWKPTRMSNFGEQNWIKTHPRASNRLQTISVKIRWELELK